MTDSINTNPWLGLTSYEFEDSYKFFGRSAETDQLAETIKNNAVTVIYGLSGSGKTSIIKAGILPKLLEDYYLPIYTRLDHNSKISYASQILKSIANAVFSQGIDIEKTCDFDYTVSDEDALWAYLHTRIFWRKDNYPVVPLLIIDQFEEIFTLNQNAKKINDFFLLVDNLYDNLPPPDVKNIIESTDNYIPFLNETKYKLVLSLREDFLARLEDYSHDIPILRKNRFGLKSIDGQQAFEVITNPIPDLVEEAVALKIIRKISGCTRDISKNELSDISVETSILSLFCSELFKKMEEHSMHTITDSLVDSTGDNIIEDYYTNTMKFVSAFTARYLEDTLLTKSGFRNTVALEDALENGVDKRSIEVLQNKRLIKIEIINGTERIEFTHDILCRVAKDKRDLRKKGIQGKVGNKYIFDGILCYSFFIIYFFSFWSTSSGLGKLILIFPFSILLTHLSRFLIKTKEKKTVLLCFIVFMLNVVTFILIANREKEFSVFFENVLHINKAFAGIFLSIFSIFFVIGTAIVAFQNLNRKKIFYNQFTWKEIFTLQCYKKFPYLVRIERDILLPVVLLICAYIIGSYFGVLWSLVVFVPFCILVFLRFFTFVDLQKMTRFFRLNKKQ